MLLYLFYLVKFNTKYKDKSRGKQFLSKIVRDSLTGVVVQIEDGGGKTDKLDTDKA